MTDYLDRRDDSATQVVDFDYTHFLCEPCQEDWTLYGLLVEQFLRWRRRASVDYFSNETFRRTVCRSLSSLCSDVLNLATLIEVAKKQKIKELNILLPYALDELELAKLRQMTKADIAQLKTDREYLKVKCN